MILKFRWYDKDKNEIVTSKMVQDEGTSSEYYILLEGGKVALYSEEEGRGQVSENAMQFTGLTDKNGIDYYLGDIGEFSNGDKFYLAMEGWLEVYIEWIGQPECYDQGRDLYRIVNAKIIGNIHQHSHLLEGENNHV